MAGLGFFVAALSWLLQVSAGTPSTWTALLAEYADNGTNETNETETTTSAAPKMAYHKVIGTMIMDVGADAQAFVDNPNSTKAIAKSLAKQIDDVTEDMLDVTLELQDASRRLAAGRELANNSDGKVVLVTYIITMAGSDAAALIAEAGSIVSAIGAITPAAMKQSLEEEFTSVGISVTLEEVVVQEAVSQAVDSEDDTVTLPPPTPTPTPSPSPSSLPSPSPSSLPSTSPSSSGGSEDQDKDEVVDGEDGSVMQSQAGIFTIVLVLLTMVHA